LSRVILHCDANSYYASVECLYTPEIREKPVAVSGNAEARHGIILTKNHIAKRYGIKTGEAIWQAKQKCPDLVCVPARHKLYSQCSRRFIEVLSRFAPVIEQVSVDEAFADMTGTARLFGPPLEAAALIKDTIHQELGFTVNVGISSNKLLAKMASDFEKPDKIHTLFPEEIPTKMWPLPVGDLFTVGRSTGQQLRQLGIRTIGDLAHTDLSLLRSRFKKQGDTLWNFANGLDCRPVAAEPDAAKSYGNCRGFF